MAWTWWQLKPKTTYTIEDLKLSQDELRAQAGKVFESIAEKVQALLEKSCDDVTARSPIFTVCAGKKQHDAARD